MILFLSLKTL